MRALRKRLLLWRQGPAAPLALFCLLALLFLFPVTLGGKALLPADDLYLTPPWSASAAAQGVTTVHNPLIADMILQNYSWKTFIRQSFRNGELPLWNPYIFTGMPFMAAGQNAALYPPGLLFVALPVALAYGWFTALHLALAGIFTYGFLRALGTSRAAATFGGVAFMFCGFLVVSFLWPMVVSSAVWLPFLLLCAERIVGHGEARTEVKGTALLSDTHSVLVWPFAGALGLALHLLAGHLEISFYVLFTVLAYSLARLSLLWWDRDLAAAARAWLALAAMALLGLGLAGVQLIPFYELIRENFRAGQVSAHEVLGWALPLRQAIAFLMPDFFGNPSHHTYFNLLTWTTQPVATARDALGEARNYPFWGIKNYVEGTAYIGVLPVLLAGVALARRWDRTTAFFALYGAFCLLLAFGSPLYALLFSVVPGFDQVHSPFRWTFPWAFSTITLAAVGLDVLLRPNPPTPFPLREGGATSSPPRLGGGQGERSSPAPDRRADLILGCGALVAGLVLLAGVALSRGFVDWSVAYAAQLRERSEALAAAFATPGMLYSYQAWPVLVLGLLLMAGGGVLVLAQRPKLQAAVPVLAVGLLALDLFQFGAGFNAATDPALPAYLPPSLRQLHDDADLFRITTFGEAQVLRPNSAMLAGLQDIRGYDTIIPRQYVDFWRLIEEPSGLLYSQINRLADPRSLTSPLLDLLNVKYVVTTQELNLPGYTPVYRSEVNIYRNEDVMPRAFAVFAAVLVPGSEMAIAALGDPGFDPRRTVILDGEGSPSPPSPFSQYWERGESAPLPPTIGGKGPGDGGLSDQGTFIPARILQYRPNRVTVAVTMPQEGYLVLSDQYFAGWRARSGEGQDLPLLRANGIFRAVQLGPGEHTVTFRYAPESFRLGLLVSVMAAAALALMGGLAAWPRLLPDAAEFSAVGRVIKNSVTPMAAQLLSRVVDFAFAVFMLRLLGPVEYGNYAFAVVLIGYFAILSDFGLGTLLTREVARSREDAGRYLTNVAAVRLALSLASAPLLAAVLWVYARFFGLPESTVVATLLFLVSLFPSAVSATISSLFSAYERMEYPALVMVLTTLLRAAAGVIVLLLGWGVVGLAVASVTASTFTAVIFVVLLLRTGPNPPSPIPRREGGRGVRWETSDVRSHFDLRFSWGLLGASFPLMINQFLNTIFFRVDVLFLQPLHGSGAVGYYSTAYKFVDGLILIPSLFTLALFPLLSRHAAVSRETLLRTHIRAVKVLLIVALPISVGLTLVADQLILTFFGADFAPSVLALQVLIWFLPFSYVNGVTQYVLIAAGRQRFITIAFLIGTAFNIVANLLLIPQYSFIGAAVTTVLSELVLLGPFLWEIRRHVGPLPLGRLLLRPAIAALVMGVVLLPVQSWNMFFLAPLGAVVYGSALLILGVFDEEDRKLVASLRWSRTRTEPNPPAPFPAPDGGARE